jgi:hypothetical protein
MINNVVKDTWVGTKRSIYILFINNYLEVIQKNLVTTLVKVQKLKRKSRQEINTRSLGHGCNPFIMTSGVIYL